MFKRSVGFLRPDVATVTLGADAPGVEAMGTSSFGVLVLDGLEIELNNSAVSFMPVYFDTVEAGVDGEVTLNDGQSVSFGASRSSDAGGYCFALHLGERALMFTPGPTVSVAAALAWLQNLTVVADGDHVTVNPRASHWSPNRRPTAAVVMALESGARCLIDVRPADRKLRRQGGEMVVEGGFLSRVAPPAAPEYLVLQAPEHVVYFIGGASSIGNQSTQNEIASLASTLFLEPSELAS